jgi:hypothetical protein
MTNDEVPPGQPLMASVARYAGGEPLRLASVVFWNVTESGLGHLRSLARSGGEAGEPPTGRFTCDVGVIAVGERRVFRLRLGTAPMVGATAAEATLPAELLARFPLEFFADQIAAIRPLAVAVDGERLYIRALGRGTFDLGVRTLGWYRGELAASAETIADAVRTLATWPAPEDAVAAIVTAPRGELDPTLQTALADRDYAQAFVETCAQQGPDVRRPLILAAHADPKLLHSLVERALRAGAPALRTIVFTAAFCALLILGGAAATVFLGTGLVNGAPQAHGRLALFAAFNKFGLIAAISIFGFASIVAGIALVVRAWRFIDARGAERRMLADGDAMSGDPIADARRDGLLALAALRGPGLAPSAWREVEAAAASDPVFVERLRAGLLAAPAANREVFLKAAPAGLRQRLVHALVARKGRALAPAARAFVAAWLACLAAGVIGAVLEPPSAALSATDWLLLAAGAAALPAIMLAVAQATHWFRSRRLMRLL